MKEFTVDFTGVKTYWYLYEAIQKGLELPEWCGKNVDALWDMLTGYIEHPAVIYLRGVNKLPKDLSPERDLIIETFQEASDYYKDGRFEIRIID